MEFSVTCPVHGQVDVGIADIASVVVREGDNVDVVFECPRCGSDILVTARVPRMLLASLDDSLVSGDGARELRMRISVLADDGVVGASGTSLPEETGAAESERIDRYCEYFRRQLENVPTADAMLDEMGQR
jgi:DNA-directed RNA polymerase subunit RPC12/RpoP